MCLSFNLQLAAQSETESNNTYQTANSLSINSTIPGTIGFTTGTTTDEDDWYVITLPSEAKIQITETTLSNLNSSIYVYDADGKNEFGSKSDKKARNDTLTYTDRAAGLFYIKLTNPDWTYLSY